MTLARGAKIEEKGARADLDKESNILSTESLDRTNSGGAECPFLSTESLHRTNSGRAECRWLNTESLHRTNSGGAE